MAILKCKMCGGDIELSADKTFGTCDSCGSTMTFPKVDDEQRANAFNRGNHFRRTGEFDKALAVYERIVQEDENDAEAHWCCALCRFGIEYVEDPNTFEFLPTCHRASFDSFLEDVDYLAALEHSDGITRRQYQKDAAKIAEVQRGILATSQNEEPFDVFICYKESENDGSRTRDSLLAQDIYYQLTEQGRRVFFSRITLEDKAGTEYEPYIFAALNSAKVMILVTTSAEHANAVWVKNEWSRFLSLMRKDRSKLLLPCYRDMDPYDLPEALSVLQSYDMSKIGFIQDLIRGVNKVLDAEKPKETVKETVVVQQQANANVAPLLKRAFMFLEDGDFARADEFCEQVLNLDPENAEAYLGKLMAELKVRKRDDLKNQPKPFDDRNNYQKTIRFGSDALKKKLAEDTAFIKDRNETARKEGIYSNALALKNAGKFAEAKSLFESIADYKAAGDQIGDCTELIEKQHKDGIYYNAMSLAAEKSIKRQQRAIEQYRTIPGWKDADEQIKACEKRIEEIKAKEEAERIETERKAEEVRIAAEKRKKKVKITALIIAIAAAVTTAVLIVLFTVILPSIRYNKAMELYNAGQYEEAIIAFEAMDGYKDSEQRIEACKTAIKDQDYEAAVVLYEAGKYEEAIAAFEALDGHKDSEQQIEACKTAIRDQDYEAAVALYEAGKYEEAIAAFKALDGHKDSKARIEACETAIKDQKYESAVALYEAGKYEKAIEAFTALDGYKDSVAQIKEIKPKYYKQLLSNARVGSTAYFGSYEQDNDTANGKEDIEWIVLAKEGNKVLVISKYALDCQTYNPTYTDVTWETCSLRKWLNGTFINNAFSTAEQNMIQSTTVTADKNQWYITTSPGNNTTDKVFLLSITEANKYFKSDEARKCAPTDYAIAQGAWTNDSYKTGGRATCWWWLRSPGVYGSDLAARVLRSGNVYFDGIDVNYGGGAVRPALWINLGF